jgi:hypothetical protein
MIQLGGELLYYSFLVLYIMKLLRLIKVPLNEAFSKLWMSEHLSISYPESSELGDVLSPLVCSRGL